MENNVLGYVKHKFSGQVFPFADVHDGHYHIVRPSGEKAWYVQTAFEEVDGPQEKDNINPDHYKIGGIETFDFIKAKLSKEALEGYCAGNILKYVTRYGHKNGVEDLKKANWYLGKMIESMEK